MKGAREMSDQAQRSRSVYIGNLPWDVSEEDLRKIFSPVGTIVGLRLPVDPESGRSRGFAFCEFREQESVKNAMSHFNGKELKGRKIRVDSAANDQDKDIKLTGPPANESQYGEPCDPVKAPENIAEVIGKMSPQQIQSIISETKRCLQADPEEARVALVNNPQMVYALLLALVRGRYITKERGTEALVKPDPALLPLFPEVRPVAPPPAPVAQPAPVAVSQHGLIGSSLLGPAPVSGLLVPPMHSVPSMSSIPLNPLLAQLGQASMGNLLSSVGRLGESGLFGPGGLMPTPDYGLHRGPQAGPGLLFPPHNDRPDLRNDRLGMHSERPAPHSERPLPQNDRPGPQDRLPPPHRDHQQANRDRDRGRERSDDRERGNNRNRSLEDRERPNNRDRLGERGRPNERGRTGPVSARSDRDRPDGLPPARNRDGDRAMVPPASRGGREGGQSMRRGQGREGPSARGGRGERAEPYPEQRNNRQPPARSSSRDQIPERPPPRPVPAASTAASSSGGSSKEEQEKAELIMQVLRLKEDDIAKMAPEQQRTVRMLRDQFKGYSK